MFGLSLGTMGAGTILGGAGVLPVAPTLSPALVNWRKGGPYGKTVLFHGDSTIAPPSPTWGAMAIKMGTAYNTPGGILDNCVLSDGGEIGQTLANVMGGSATYNITWLNSQPFDLLVARWGINDVKLGLTTLGQMTTLLTNYVNAVLAAKPNACIILVTPNSFLLDDPTGTGYVVPQSSAQAYTDILWGAYDAVKNLWPNSVAVYDSQTLVYGRTCGLGVNRPLMQDVIHPLSLASGPDGYTAQNDGVAQLMRPRGWPFTTLTSNDAFLAENVLLLNGDSLTDARGRHTLSNASGTVTATGGWLVFNGSSGLSILGNLSDFNFGKTDGTTDTGLLTFEAQIISPANARPNGQYYLTNGVIQIGNGPDPNYQTQVFGSAGITLLGSGGANQTGAVANIALTYSHGRVATYLNGARTSLGFSNADFTAGGAAAMFVGQATDAWSAVYFQGQMRIRVRKENCFNNTTSYTPYPGQWPTT